MYPELYNSAGDKLAVLNNIIKESATIYRIINGEFTFKFQAYEEELKSEYFNTDNTVKIDSQTFDIKYIEQMHETSVLYAIECEHVNYRLVDDVLSSYAGSGTPAAILADILTGTDFSVGTIEFTDPVTLTVQKEVTKKELIKELANLLGAEIEYTAEGFTINLLNTIGQNNGFEVRLGKNLKGIKKTVDRRGELKTYYEVSLIELKNSNEYIEKGLQDLEVVEIGDTIRIVDEVLGLDIENRILSKEYNPIFAVNTALELVNSIEFVTDTVTEIATTAVIQDTLYNNSAISQEYGYRATRSDQLARATIGADNISLDTGDGLGNYTPAVYFDPLSGTYKFEGDVEVSGLITGATIIGSSINNGSGTFLVDTLGNVQANSLTIGGGSGIANLSDSGDLAVLDTVDTGEIENGAVIASKISVGSLSAISADLGTITAGTINSVTIDISEDVSIGDTLILNPTSNLNGIVWDRGGFDPEISINISNDTMGITNYDGDIDISAVGTNVDVNILADDLTLNSSSVITSAGNGLDKSGNTLDVDPIELAGYGLKEDLSNNLEIDTSVVITAAGNGLDKNGTALDIDCSEIAGDGLREDSSNNLEVDVTDIIGTGLTEDASNNITVDFDVVPKSVASAGIQFQVVSGFLEWRQVGVTSFARLQNA